MRLAQSPATSQGMDACLRLLLHKEGAALADSLEESWLGVAAAAAKLERVYAKAHPGAEVREGELLAFLRFLRGAGGAADVPCAVRALHMLTRSPCAVAGIGAEPEARSFRQTVLAHAREAFVATVPPPRVLASMLKTARCVLASSLRTLIAAAVPGSRTLCWPSSAHP